MKCDDDTCYYEEVPGAVCLMRADGSEHIVQYNSMMLSLFQCETREDFIHLTGGILRGMVLADHYPAISEQLVRWQKEHASGLHYLTFEILTGKSHVRRIDANIRLIEREGELYWSCYLADAGLRRLTLDEDKVGLLTREGFFKEALNQAKQDKEQKRFGTHCPVYFNITNFKFYNANRGYAAGDDLLGHMAFVLRESLPGAILAHLSADSFLALAPVERLTVRVEQVCRQMNRFIAMPGVAVKAGLRFYSPKDKSPVTAAFDQAKMACDEAKKDAKRNWVIYREEMGERLQMRNYVLTHFAEAMRKGHIKVYLQPCMRLLTGKLCNVEALMRWEDPQRGMISPAIVIPVLEESGLIHELDAFMIRSVVRLLHYQQENGLPLVPVSVNLSSLDFVKMDPFAIAEEVTERYSIAHDYLHFELTETSVVRDEGILFQAIQKFHRAGYHVWLDDFGSGYSSLNVLKDYPFDLLKIDMAFLKTFNKKSRDIIFSIVRMAKKIGIHTLAEGVETEEQMRFLRAIGCERIQGYYYGRPMQPEKLHDALEKQQYQRETRAEAQLYNTIGLTDIPAHASIALFTFDGENPALLMGNSRFWTHSSEIGIRDQEQVNHCLRVPNHPFRVRFLNLMKRVDMTHGEQSMTFSEQGHYVRVMMSRLGASRKLVIYQAQFDDITMERAYDAKEQRFDQIMRNLCLLYQYVFFLHAQQDTCEVLIGTQDWAEDEGGTCKGIGGFFAAYAEAMVYPADRARFLAYIDMHAIRAALLESGQMTFSNCFRIRQPDGSYAWMRFDTVPLYLRDPGEYLVCVQPLIIETQPGARDCIKAVADAYGLFAVPDLAESMERDAMLWRSFIAFDEACIFWKDSRQRFLGANEAFLDFFGFHDEADIVGRTDHELGLHIVDPAVRQAGERLLQDGRPQYRDFGECIAQGGPRAIYSNRFPLYREGKVEGIIGRFWEFGHDLDDYRDAVIDKETGYTNYRGMLMAGIEFMDNYLKNGEDFTAVYFYVPGIESAARSYGEAFRRELLQRLAEEVHAAIVPGSVLAHIGSGRFLCFHKLIHEQRLRDRLLRLANAIHNIRSVRGCPCTLYLQYAVGYGSETKSIEGLLQLLVERGEAARKDHLGESIYIGDRIAFDREKFDHMNERVYMCDPETYDLVYINQAIYRDFHLPEDFSCAGKKCYEVIVGGKEPCEFCTNHLLRRDKFYMWTYHNALSGLDYLLRDTLVPWRGKNYRFSMSIDLSEYLDRDIERNELIYREASINDALAIALREEDPSKSIQKMLWKIGSELNADRISIFERGEEQGTVSNTYEWCRNGVEPMKAKMQRVPLTPCFLYDTFREQHIVRIPDYEAYLAEHPHLEHYLPDIRRFIAVPLKISDKIIGHVQIVNSKEQVFQASSYLMMTLSRFIAIMIRNRDAARELERMSQRDQMTGLLNRRGLSNYFMDLPKGISCAFFFGDVNGLKRMNDEHGHEAGDALIKTVADIMLQAQQQAGKGHVFRMGGDEFLMIVEQSDEAQADAIQQALREAFRTHHVSVALGALVSMTPILDMDAIITKVDREMYKDKGKKKR